MKFSNLLTLLEKTVVLEYTEKYIQQEYMRLKPMAGPFIDENTLIEMIKWFGELKDGNSKTAIIQLVKNAIAQSKKPENERDGIDISPYLTPAETQSLSKIINQDPSTYSSNDSKLMAKYSEELKRIEKLEKDPLNLSFYNFTDLEKVLDQFPPKDLKRPGTDLSFDADKYLVYNQNNLLVYFLPSADLSWKIKEAVEGMATKNCGKQVSIGWCIAYSPPRGSMFQSYRLPSTGRDASQLGHSLYMVYDKSKPCTDKWFITSIQAANTNAEKPDNKKVYFVTSSKNDGDTYKTWDQIVQLIPNLNGLQNIFKPVPMSQEEKDDVVLASANSKNFSKLNYRQKIKYFETMVEKGKKIYSKDYGNLDAQLQHLYVQYRYLNPNAPAPTIIGTLMMMFEDSSFEKNLQIPLKDLAVLRQENKKEFYDFIPDKVTGELKPVLSQKALNIILTNSKMLTIPSGLTKKSETFKLYAKYLKDQIVRLFPLPKPPKQRPTPPPAA